MIKICFVCLGNICRSPMAEFMFKKKLSDLGLQEKFYVTSKATSSEESGNDIYPPAKRKLLMENIPITSHCATRLEKEDYHKYNYFICMEKSNVRNALHIFQTDPENKVFCLYDITSTPKDIADPWYTGDFNQTWSDLDVGLNNLIDYLTKE